MKPARIVRTPTAIIGTNRTDTAATAAGVKDNPTEEATSICPIGRVNAGTRTGRFDSRTDMAKTIAPIIQGRGRFIQSPTKPNATAPI